MWVARRFISSVAQRGQYAGQSGLFRRPQCCSPPGLELRYLQCTCCWRSRVPVAGLETLIASISSSSTEPCNEVHGERLDTYYTAEQRDAILLVLNNASAAEMASIKMLRGRRSLNIMAYRTQNGPYKTLESILNVPQLKHKTAIVVFDSILNPVTKEEKKKKKKEKKKKEEEEKKVKTRMAKFIKPEVGKSWLEDAKSIVSIICGTNKIAWAHVSCSMAVLDWQEFECPHFMTGTYMASSYLQDVSAFVSVLPRADFYLIEKSSSSLQNMNLYPYLAHIRSVEAMLFALLEQRNNPPNCNIPPKVLNIMRTSVGRHFGLMVGESRTSGTQLLQKLMEDSMTQKVPRITFPVNLLLKYKDSFDFGSRRQGEELCDAVLQALAFYELVSESV